MTAIEIAASPKKLYPLQAITVISQFLPDELTRGLWIALKDVYISATTSNCDLIIVSEVPGRVP
jgi:hypothetical protein